MVLGRLLWGTGKLAVKYVIVPIAVTVVAAAVLGELNERVKQKSIGLEAERSGNQHLALAA